MKIAPFILLFLILLPAAQASSSIEVEAAKKSVRALITPLLPGNTKTKNTSLKGFRVDTCERKKIDWMEVLLRKKEVTLEYDFRPGCDIKGITKPRVLESFPASFNLRNIETYSHIASQNRITATFETKPVLTLNVQEGVLQGKKGKVKFEADYRVRINPLKKDDPVEQNLGGELRIKEIYGAKVNIKEKIYVK
jgi:hypothetical protein